MKKIIALLALCASFSALADTRQLRDTAVIVDQLDANVLDTSVTNINGSAGALLTVVSALSSATAFCQVSDTTGGYIGLYSGATLKSIITPGMDGIFRCAFDQGAAIKLRSMETATISAGKIVIQFMK